MKVIYVRSFSHGGNIATNVYQWELLISPEISQQKMNDLFHGFKFICADIYELFILTKGDWIDHVHTLELMINKLKPIKLSK